MKLTTTISALCILLLPSAALSASCYGANTDLLGVPFGALAEAAWEVRRKMCDNSNCAFGKDCTTTSVRTASGGGYRWRADANLDRWKFFKSGILRMLGEIVPLTSTVRIVLLTSHGLFRKEQSKSQPQTVRHETASVKWHRDIIRQCIQGERETGGFYQWNGQYYRLNMDTRRISG